MKDRLRRRRRSMVMPAKYRRKPQPYIYGTGGRIEMQQGDGTWLDIGAALHAFKPSADEMAQALVRFQQDIAMVNEQLRARLSKDSPLETT